MPWFIKDAFDFVGKEYKRYRIINELNRLTDRELKDIGLTRGEIPFVVAESMNK